MTGTERLAAWRAEQHETALSPSDAQLAAFLAGCDAGNVALDRAARMSPLEVRMLMHTRNAA